MAVHFESRVQNHVLLLCLHLFCMYINLRVPYTRVSHHLMQQKTRPPLLKGKDAIICSSSSSSNQKPTQKNHIIKSSSLSWPLEHHQRHHHHHHHHHRWLMMRVRKPNIIIAVKGKSNPQFNYWKKDSKCAQFKSQSQIFCRSKKQWKKIVVVE